MEYAMFIYSVKATTLRFVLILVLSVSVLIGLSAFYAAEEPVLSSVSYEGIRTETDRRGFLSAFGYQTTGDAKSTVEYALPATLDAVLLGYNELQKEQGTAVPAETAALENTADLKRKTENAYCL